MLDSTPQNSRQSNRASVSNSTVAPSAPDRELSTATIRHGGHALPSERKDAAFSRPSLLTSIDGKELLGERFAESVGKSLSGAVISPVSAQGGAVLKLFAVIDSTHTRLGSAALLRSLLEPPTDYALVMARQQSVLELEENTKLRSRLEEYFVRAKAAVTDRGRNTDVLALQFHDAEHVEQPFTKGFVIFDWLRSQRDAHHPMRIAFKMLRANRALIELARDLPEPESPYLAALVSQLKGFPSHPDMDLLRGPMLRTWGAVKTRMETAWYEPAISLVPRFFTVPLFLSGASVVGFMKGIELFMRLIDDKLSDPTHAFTTNFALPLGVLQTMVVFAIYRGLYHRRDCLPLMRQRLRASEAYTASLDAFAQIDELLALSRLGEKWGRFSSIPVLSPDPVTSLAARSLRNPTLVSELGGERVVPNDVRFHGGEIQVITGPNSGGKTTFCVAVFQNQLLAQVGARVTASEYVATVADKFVYQLPMYFALHEEGRFGSELMLVRDVFMNATPRSFIMLDELAEGTTAEERLDVSRGILWGFSKVRCGTFLVTHNHALARLVEREKLGKCRMVALDPDQKPTYRLVDGISTHSFAAEVASRVGFGIDDIRKSLRVRGYLNDDQGRTQSGSDMIM